jgi:hypothetical protein
MNMKNFSHICLAFAATESPERKWLQLTKKEMLAFVTKILVVLCESAGITSSPDPNNGNEQTQFPVSKMGLE